MIGTQRRKADGQNVPVRLVINYVGVALMIALGIEGYLVWLGKSSGQMQTIIISSITGLLALLGRTSAPEQPTATPQPVEVVNPPDAPVPVETTPAAPDTVPDELAGLPPAVDDGGDDLTNDTTTEAETPHRPGPQNPPKPPESRGFA